ncbi:TetR/AcrR family transcriptional regulator [Kutzneria kofuensis]
MFYWGMASAPKRRDRKRQDVSDRLYEAARDLFVARGFEATTMDDIAAEADVARATVFNHYKTKAAFLEEWGRQRRIKVAAALSAEQADDLSTPDQIRHYLRELARLNVESRRETAALMDAAMRHGDPLRGPALETELTKTVERGQQIGELQPQVDPAVAGRLLAAGYFSTVLRWVHDDPAPFDLAEQLDDMASLVLRGLVIASAAAARRGSA